jgi:signal transduction histidine kinase
MGPSKPRPPILPLSGVALLTAVLILLAVLQYRWSLELSRAEGARIQNSLNTAVSQFRQEFDRELVQVAYAFRRDLSAEPDDIWSAYAQDYGVWARTSSHPDLVADVLVYETGRPAAAARLLELSAADGQFAVAAWPPSLSGLKGTLDDLRGSLGRGRGGDDSRQPPVPPGPDFRAFAWTLEQKVPALVRPVFDAPRPRWRLAAGDLPDRPGPDPGGPPRPVLLGFVIVQLNTTVLDRLLGELAQRYFSGPDGFIYHVEVVGQNPAEILYRSDPNLDRAALIPPDARVPLLGPSPAENRSLVSGPPPSASSGRRGMRRGPLLARTRGAIILPSTHEPPWQLLVRHRGGSLEAVVAADRHRNLLLSFGVLALLVASTALIVVSAHRARSLARLQMEFVAGVSHELRTPVAVICSAADNLADGFVHAREQVKEYGNVIRGEGRRLAVMIEQILHFAAGQSRRVTYDLAPVGIAELLSAVLANISALPDAAGFTFAREIEPDLPAVQADAAAVTRCVENLVWNAVKYSGANRSISVRAQKAGDAAHPAVRVSVEDRGMGIDPVDLAHIFEPFYRGKAAQSAQIHGAGLGLSLAREIAEAMGGALRATSQPGRGSTFTLDLPAAAPADKPLARTA